MIKKKHTRGTNGMLHDPSPTSHASSPPQHLDRAAALGRIGRLASLSDDWNGHGARPIDPDVIEAASRLVELLPADVISTPQVVPMTRGRLQFEWHRGNRSLELEFESPTLIHFLKYDPDHDMEEEDVFPVEDTTRAIGLLRWFTAE